MATKKPRPPGRLYVKAHQSAYTWAHKAVVYRHARKFAQAKAAAQKARRWLRKISC